MSTDTITRPRKWHLASVVTEDHECPTCGFGYEVKGYDCLVCETVYNLEPEQMTLEFAAQFYRAMGHAFAAAQGAA